MNTTNRGRGGLSRPGRAPIGLLLVELDRLINERFERALGGRDVTRRQWQLLNVIAEGPATEDELADAVAPFLDRESGEGPRRHLDPLARRGLVRSEQDAYALTDAGRDWFALLAGEVRAVRELTVAGMGEGEYEAVVTGLRRMIDNLEHAD